MRVPRRSGALLACSATLALTGCVGLKHTSPTTTTVAPGPPHLVALVTLIGSGSAAGSGSTLEAIDLSARPVVMRAITVGVFPDAVAVAPDHDTAYVASYTSSTVTPVDLRTGRPGRAIAVGNGPAGIAIAPDGKTAYVTDAGTTPIGDTVTPINLKKGRALAPITVGNGPQGIAITPDGSTAYVTDAGAVVTGQTGSIGNTVSPIDLRTGVALAPITVGNGPLAVAISPDGSTAYVANANSGSVTPIAVATNTAGTPVPLDGAPQALATTGTSVWVADTSSAVAGGNNLTALSEGAITPGVAVALPPGPSSVAIAPGGATAWVVSGTADRLVPVDLRNGKALSGGVTLPGGPYAVALVDLPEVDAKALTAPVRPAKKAA